MKRIKVVQIGIGHDHASAAIGSLKKADLFDLAGYVILEGEEDMFQANKNAYDGVNRLSLSEAFAIPNIEAAVIETEDYNLTKYALIAAEHGLNIHMDKPGGQDGKEFEKLIFYVKTNKLIFHTGYMYRYNPAIKKAIEMVKNKDLGEIYYVDAQMNCRHNDIKRKWLKSYQGGMMNFLGCHLVDIILQIQGEPKEIIPFNTVTRPEDIGAEDFGMAILKYEHGISFAKSTAVESSGFMRRQIVICGEKGTIEINPTEYSKPPKYAEQFTDMKISMAAEHGADWGYNPQKVVFGPFDRYEDMFKEFALIVGGEITNPYSYEYELKLHNTLLKACGLKGKQ
jgi:predicted dehydrogenase